MSSEEVEPNATDILNIEKKEESEVRLEEAETHLEPNENVTETVAEEKQNVSTNIEEPDQQLQTVADEELNDKEMQRDEKALETPLSETQESESVADDYDVISQQFEIQEVAATEVNPEEETKPAEEEEIESHPLDDLTDQQVIDLVQEVETENRHLQLENNLFESFLKENDPSLLEGVDDMMEFLFAKQSYSSTLERHSAIIDKNRFKLDSYTSITSIAEGKGPKINLSQKTDMVMRAMEENQSSLEAFLKKCHVTKRNLKSELEEFSIRESEIKEATEIFEYSVVTQGVDKLTQRIPAEKFIRYMEEWLKSAQLQIEKLRLRIATLKVQYKKVSQQLIQRQELGENVHAVDFDQLEIENKHFIEKIEQKNVHLIELKKMNGGANLILSTHKKFLQKQQEDCNKLKSEIAEKNKQIEATERECDQADEELDAEIEKYENCKELKSKYTVPHVMEYVKLKARLHEIRKNIKIWVRRRKIQDIALNTCLREMKNLTGNTEIDPHWFEEVQSLSDTSDSSNEKR